MIGLLWYNRARKPLEDAIRDASKRFSEKFGAWPCLVCCNPMQLAEARIQSEHIESSKLVSPDYLQVWGEPLVKCPNCGRPNSDDATTCWKCGVRLR